MKKMIVEMNWAFNQLDHEFDIDTVESAICLFKGTILSVESFPFGIYKIIFEVTLCNLLKIICYNPWNNRTTFFSEDKEWNPDSFENLDLEEEGSKV